MIIYYPQKNYPLKFTPIHKPLTNHPPFRSAIDKPVVKYWILGSTPYRSQAHLNWQATHVFGAPEDPDSEDEVLFFVSPLFQFSDCCFDKLKFDIEEFFIVVLIPSIDDLMFI
jgi:hypothetical protein